MADGNKVIMLGWCCGHVGQKWGIPASQISRDRAQIVHHHGNGYKLVLILSLLAQQEVFRFHNIITPPKSRKGWWTGSRQNPKAGGFSNVNF